MKNTNIGLLILASLVLGCSHELKRLPISGTVNLDDQPIENCLLVFQPAKDADCSAGSTAVVTNGSFALNSELGLPSGTYSVLVMENQPDLEEYEDRKAKNPRRALDRLAVPQRYRVPGALTITVESPHQIFDFSMRTK